MDDNYMESLARAYNEKLRNILSPELTASVAAAEEQLALLECLNPQRKRLLSYLRSLKQTILLALLAEVGNNAIPSYRNLIAEGGLNRIIDLELEIFIALDTLRGKSENDASAAFIDKITAMEVRFSALLGNLR